MTRASGLAMLAHRVRQRAAGLFDKATAGKLTYPQFYFLDAVSLSPGICQRELTEDIGMDASTMTDLVKRMKAREFVRVQRAEPDARMTRLWLLPAGKAILRKGRAAHRATKKRLCDGLSASEIETMRTLLQNMGTP